MASTTLLTMVLAGGEGARLQPLTRDRAKPAVPFGGHYRIIDFVLSNFINSGFYKIKVLTQYKSDSLNRHLSRGYRMNSVLGHYLETVPAQMRKGTDWFKGSADAIYQNLHIFADEDPQYAAVFGADHIYKMDIRQMLNFHVFKKADCTIAAVPVPLDEAHSFGIMEVNTDWQLIGFQEKPSDPKPMPGRPDMALASMGNYIFTVKTLINAIEEDGKNSKSSHDFGKNIIPNLYPKARVFIYDFTKNIVPGQSEIEKGYWRDVGNIDAYYQANMDLVSVSPVCDIHNRNWPILTYSTSAPPAKFVFADEATRRIGIATDSLVSEGCIISGGHINRCILSPFVRINSYANVDSSILFDSVDVGRYAKIRRAIVDKNVKIPPYTEIGYDLKKDKRRGFTVTDSGIVVIPKGMKIDE